MIFWRAKEILEGGSELFRAEAELMSKRLTRLLIGSVAVVVIAFMAVVGLLLATSGAAIALSDQIGWAGSLAIIGGAYLIACLLFSGAYYILRTDSKAPSESDVKPADESKEPKAKAEDAKDRLDNAASSDPDQQQDQSKDHEGLLDGLDTLKDTAIEAGIKNPIAFGSAALLVLSLIGPKKSIKMISRGVAAAGIASTLLDSLGTTNDPASSNSSTKT